MPIDPRRLVRSPSRAARVAGPLLAALVSGSLVGCVASVPGPGRSGGGAGGLALSVDGPGDPALATASVSEPVRDLPKSRRGNMAEYTVFGKRYRTLDSSAGFTERGVASWYGAKFHGRDTSSGEPFDMHAMTAAHRQLPLPTFVRVTSVATGRAIVVKVNDRGPFADDRIIDLSYAAAARLGMLESGTAEVTLEALSTHVEPAAGGVAEPPVASSSPPANRSSDVRAEVGDAAAPDMRPDIEAAPRASARLIQLGAFSDDARAHSLARRAAPHLGAPPRVVHDAGRALWRVRAGPFADAAAVDAALAGLASAGIDDYTLLVAAPR